MDPGDPTVPERWGRAYSAFDWPAMRALMADDFTAGGPATAQRIGPDAYLASCRRIYRRYYRSTALSVEECRAEQDGSALWVRYAQHSVERGGRPLDSVIWERLQLDAAGERIVALDSAGVVSVT